MGIATGSLVAFAFRIVETVLWAAIGVLTARLLTVSDRGVYATAIVVTSAAGSISSFASATGYFVANRQRRGAEVAGNSIAMVAPIAGALVIGGVALWVAADSEDGRIVALAVLSLAPQVVRNSTLGVILGEGALVKYNIAGDVPIILGAGFLGVWVGFLDHRSAQGAMEAWCAAQWASLLPLGVWGWGWLKWLVSHRPDTGLMKAMLTFTGVTGLASVIGLLHSRVDQILVIRLDGEEGAGIYSSAIAVAQLLLVFSGSVTTAAFARVGREARAEAALLTATAVRHTVLVVIGGGVAAALAGPFLIEVLFGRAYEEASQPLRILCLGTALHAPHSLLNLFFVNQLGRPQIAVGISLAAFVVSLVSGFLLIPSLGTSGAAWATTISYAFATAVALVIFLRRTGVPASALWRIRLSDVRAYFDLGLSVLGELRKLARRAAGRSPSGL